MQSSGVVDTERYAFEQLSKSQFGHVVGELGRLFACKGYRDEFSFHGGLCRHALERSLEAGWSPSHYEEVAGC